MTASRKYTTRCSVIKTYSTKQVAKLVGVHRITLHQWRVAGKVRPSQAIRLNAAKHWRWTKADVEQVLKYKAAHYRKGRGRKKKKA